MTQLVSWLVFPLALAALSLGWGLLVEAVAGLRLPGALLLPVGFAAIVVAADFATLSAATARLMLPSVLAGAVVGAAVRRRRLAALRPDPWISAAGVLAYAAYLAPVAFSGQATFAGYATLDDTANWFALTERAISHGRSVAGLVPSSYTTVVHAYLTSGYPLGSFMPLGAGAKLVNENVAWVFQPYLAFQAALLALGLWAIVGSLVREPRLRALTAFVAAQPALLYGYALWGAVKELVTAPLLVVLAILVAHTMRAETTVRRLVPLVVVTAAVLAVLNVGGGVWLAPALLPLVVLFLRPRRSLVLRTLATAAGTLVLLAAPTVAIARAFLASAPDTLGSSATGADALGSVLYHRLSFLQLLGIWPVGDFRVAPATIWPTYLILLALLALAGVGLFLTIRRRAFALPVYLATCVIGLLIVTATGSPWTIGKALATASPAVLALGLAAALGTTARQSARLALIAAAIAVTGGVLWSNALAYSGARLAPRAQLAEQARIGERFSGQGPALMIGFQWYYAQYFFHGLDPTWVTPNTDFDTLPLAYVLRYPTLVLTRDPLTSRPPSNYRLAWQGRFDEIWQRMADAPTVLRHLPLGANGAPGATPTCSDVRSLARLAASRHGRIAYAPEQQPIVLDLSSGGSRLGWPTDGTGAVYPTSSGRISFTVVSPRTAVYEVWAGGFTPGTLSVSVDGTNAGSVSHLIERDGQEYPINEVRLTAGSHRVIVDYSRPLLDPGSTAHNVGMSLGPVVLSSQIAPPHVRYTSPTRVGRLCHMSLDWLEAVAP